MLPCERHTFADFDNMKDIYHIQFKDVLLGQDWLELYITEILDACYKWTDVKDSVDKQLHLTAHQTAGLLDVLKQNEKLIDGSLGFYPHCKVHIDINPDAKLVHA